jgi:hypothetical protein
MSRSILSLRLKPETSFWLENRERGESRGPPEEASNELQSTTGTAHGDELGKTGATDSGTQRTPRAPNHESVSLERRKIHLGWANVRVPVHAYFQRVELIGLLPADSRAELDCPQAEPKACQSRWAGG